MLEGHSDPANLGTDPYGKKVAEVAGQVLYAIAQVALEAVQKVNMGPLVVDPNMLEESIPSQPTTVIAVENNIPVDNNNVKTLE